MRIFSSLSGNFSGRLLWEQRREHRYFGCSRCTVQLLPRNVGKAESRTIVTKGWKVGKLGRCWLKGTKLQLCRTNKPGDLMQSVGTIVNNTL